MVMRTQDPKATAEPPKNLPGDSGVARTMPSIRSLRTDVFASALVAAAEAGQLEELQLLLTKGDADAQTVVRSGNTALRAATALGDADCICELLRHGANIDLETSRGTALLAASVQGEIDTLLLLLEKGATVDYETASGTTALSAAIKQRRPAAVQLLLSRGADLDRANAHGVTPLAVAQDVEDMHILALLQQAQVQQAAEEALTSLDHSSRQAQITSEAQQDLDLKVMILISVSFWGY
ncbi:TPA: hypothetical protein ACH3X2_006778 [Trebouxia sp. C0005]